MSYSTIVDKILQLLGFHRHYYGVWHVNSAGQMVQTCYECGKNRKLKINISP